MLCRKAEADTRELDEFSFLFPDNFISALDPDVKVRVAECTGLVDMQVCFL